VEEQLLSEHKWRARIPKVAKSSAGTSEAGAASDDERRQSQP